MDVRRSRLPKNPVNIGLSAQKSAKQGDGPSARGTQSTKEGNSYRGSAPGPMQGEVSPYDPLFSAHPALSSQRQSLCGTQNNPPRSDLLKYSYNLYRSGARFCSKGHRITLFPGAARMPIKSKAAQPYFKAHSHKDVKSKIKNQGIDLRLVCLLIKGLTCTTSQNNGIAGRLCASGAAGIYVRFAGNVRQDAERGSIRTWMSAGAGYRKIQ